MATNSKKQVEYLVVDTTAFIQNASLHEVADIIITCQEVVDEITNKRQLRRLIVLPYDLIIKDVFPENIKIVTDFSKKTGDYPSLSATDIKVMALTYQLEKEKVGIENLRTEPVLERPILNTENPIREINPDITGFYLPHKNENQNGEECSPETDTNREFSVEKEINKEQCNIDIGSTTKTFEDINVLNNEEKCPVEKQSNKEQISSDTSNITRNMEDNINLENDNQDILYEKLSSKFQTLNCDESDLKPKEDVLIPVKNNFEIALDSEGSSNDDLSDENDDDDDDIGWITPSNISQAKKQVNSQLMEEKHVVVACMTTDFAMQNVLRQMNLNVSALDGRLIKQLRTYILRCYSCFKTTSKMDKKFCPKCGNDTLKKVAVSVDEMGKVQIHINSRKPLTGRGKKFSLPKIKGGKHPHNPILVADQPMPDNKPTRLARTKNNPLDDDYIAGFSPFIMRDVNSKSAQLGIRPGSEFKHWMKKNPNESRRRKK